MSCPSKLRKELYRIQSNRCFLCGFLEDMVKGTFNAHRLKPSREGGLYIKGNVVLCCTECHIKVEGLTVEEVRLLEPYGRMPVIEG